MARNPSIYTGLQQGAAIRRNRHLRAAHAARDLIERYPFGLPYQLARVVLDGVEGSFLMSPGAAVALAEQLLRDRLSYAIERARYHHRDWKVWSSRNRQWRAEMAALDIPA